MAGPGKRRARRSKGGIEELPSGSFRVYVYAGTDPVTKRKHYLRELVPAGPGAADEAEKVLRRLGNQVDERRHPRTNATVDQLLDKHFAMVTLERRTLETYQGYADKHIRPLIGTVPVGSLGADVFDSFYAELRRCRDHCIGRGLTDHRTPVEHDCDARCRPHTCRPLGASTIRQIHFILSGALKRAVRWRWLATNPIAEAEPPKAPKPNPQPPTPEEAGRILEAAWAADPDWGTLVWLAIVTGIRRGELCGLRWRDVDLDKGVLALSRSIGQRNRETWEKDTKTHQHRRIALDPETVEILTEHRRRCEERADEAGLKVAADAFVFSLAPDGSTYLRPNSVSERYSDLVDKLRIRTSLHKLRHYTATELIAAGVDVRTVAGRLGHGGGGTTTLRVYAAWVSESDQRAASSLFSRMPARPRDIRTSESPAEPRPRPHEALASTLERDIEAGTLASGASLPSARALATEHRVEVSAARQALTLLTERGYIEVVTGRGFRVVAASNPAAPPLTGVGAAGLDESRHAVLLDLVVRRHGEVEARFSAEADPRSATDLHGLLRNAIRRRGGDVARIAEYEMELRRAGDDDLITTFVAPRLR
ncbi:MAG: tyrosine-type recombinase/integrase [Dehalococcoidia bacterium]